MNELRSKSGGFRDTGKKSGRSRAESSLRGSVLLLPRSIPLLGHTPSEPFKLSLLPEPRRKRREHLRDPMLSSRLAACQQRGGVSLPFAISPRVIYPLHSRAQLFSRGENRLQSTDYFESARISSRRRFGPVAQPGFPRGEATTSKVTRSSRALPPRFDA